MLPTRDLQHQLDPETMTLLAVPSSNVLHQQWHVVFTRGALGEKRACLLLGRR